MKVAAARKLIRKYVNKWVTPMGLGWWNVDVYYHMNKKEARKYFKTKKREWMVLGRTLSEWEYRTAAVHFNTHALSSCSATEIEKTVVHELVHILVCEMREVTRKHEEAVVVGLERAFQWVREAAK